MGKETKDKDKINEKSSMPLAFTNEMLESFRDILNNNKFNFMV